MAKFAHSHGNGDDCNYNHDRNKYIKMIKKTLN